MQDWTLIVGSGQQDVGGTARASMQWRNFLEGAHGIVFLVDANNAEDFPIAKSEIESLVNNHYALKSSMMILFNKKDLLEADQASNLNRLLIEMNLSNRTLTENNIEKKMISLLTGEGFEDCLKILYSAMNELVKKY